VVTTVDLWQDYVGPVDALPNDCNFSGHIIESMIRERPVLQKPNPLAAKATSAQVVAGVPPQWGFRQVAYRYTFTRLRLLYPPIYQGLFLVDSVRTIVHKGPTSAYPVASDTSVQGTDQVAFVNSVGQQLASGTGAAAINNTWLVRNITTGRWRAAPGMPLTFAQVSMACTVTVQPAASSVLQ
jgi:hypothetical protein